MSTRRGAALLPSALRGLVASLADARSRPEGPLFLAAAVGTELAKAVDHSRLEHLAKPLIAPAALAVALRGGRPDGVDTALLGLAGAAYTAGDVVLMRGDGHHGSIGRLARGAGAFGVGHLALVALLWRAGVRPAPAHAAVQALPTLGSAAYLLGERGGAALAAYPVVLSALSTLATSALPGATDPARALLAAGGPVFQLSDALILVRRRLRTGSVAARAVDVAVIDTYALACLLLLTGAAGVARVGRRP